MPSLRHPGCRLLGHGRHDALAASPAFAFSGDPNCHVVNNANYQYQTFGCEYGTTQVTDYGQFNLEQMSQGSPNTPTAVSQELTAWSGSYCDYYIQGGAWVMPSTPINDPPHLFVNDHGSGGNSSFDDGPAPLGSGHRIYLVYQGPYGSAGGYTAAIDGTQLLVDFDFGFGTCRSTVGGQIDTFEPFTGYEGESMTYNWNNLQWTDLNNAYHYSFNSSSIDEPCGQGYSYPQCFNGAFYYGNSQWSDNFGAY